MRACLEILQVVVNFFYTVVLLINRNFFYCSSVLEDCKWGSDRIEYFTKHFLVCKLCNYTMINNCN